MKGLLFAFRVYSGENFRGLKRLTELFAPMWNGGSPFPPGLVVAGIPPPSISLPTVPEGNFEDKKSEGILWGVPKHRKTIEKRLKKKFGSPEWFYKMIIPKYNLLVCDNCGHHYEAKHLCRNCYAKTEEETKRIRETINQNFGDGPVDKDVIVLYETDKAKGLNAEGSSSSKKNQMIIEIPKERPNFFSPNLLQKSTIGINRKAKDLTETMQSPIVHKSEN